MAIGPISFDRPEITLNPEGKGSFGKNVYIGNIGGQLLAQLNLVIDLPARKIYLKKFPVSKPTTPTDFAFGWLNRTDIGAGWIVRALDEGGVADRAGILLGDTIIAVNGKDVRSIKWKEEGNLNDLPEMSVTVQRGKDAQTIKMVAEDRWK
jgi:S1-C subfamily serine protease